MSRVVIQSLGPGEKLGAAAVPTFNRGAAAYQSRGIISGSPGTRPTPAPPPPVPQDTTALGIIGGYHRSSQTPAVWYPGVYYQDNTTDPPEHAPVSVLSDNQMPMPAINPLGPAAVMMGRPRLGGQYQIQNRAAVPAYPNMAG